ncbi:hypothetical protein VIOR3934_01673 [Vibrio orientalis CIP 102891 = ATCC 33934]|uniref:Uncharacterized protein n=1 Tax=Vibrio orientalis CIP 102891 = ATCC 33934 TaxID=675816 RepID=C9QKN4_VIBOR|nr:membrane protein [Vibrio orientalis]EEX92369.1 hypothetical protein VIA_003014 [Vibrio orientalis CIP 102891 = ATCC 33934]EGU51806.1 hypothetical protein VIOR3934_01673 [Vibrio orientalis CIP 102891 = ATCC 33934]
MSKPNKGIWVAYVLSFFTPFTCLISGVVAIIYAGYRLDKGEDGEIVDSHYYGLIRSFFLNLTYFVVLIITVATSNGVLVGLNDYWYKSHIIDEIAYYIPYVGMVFGMVAIVFWLLRMIQGMKKLQANEPFSFSKGPNL